jgi:hypothetical protein
VLEVLPRGAALRRSALRRLPRFFRGGLALARHLPYLRPALRRRSPVGGPPLWSSKGFEFYLYAYVANHDLANLRISLPPNKLHITSYEFPSHLHTNSQHTIQIPPNKYMNSLHHHVIIIHIFHHTNPLRI